MLQRLKGKRRIEISRKAVLTDLVGKTLPAGTPLALRVFGDDKPGSCDTRLALRWRRSTPTPVGEADRRHHAEEPAKTPIAASLRQVVADLRGAPDRAPSSC